MQPFVRTDIFAAKIAVTNTKAFAQRFVCDNFAVQLFHLGHQFVQRFIIQPILIMDEALGIKPRFDLKEAETAAERIIDHGKTAVCRVHHTDDI